MKAVDLGWMAGSIQISNSSQLQRLPEEPRAESSDASTDLWIFRDGRKAVSGTTMLRGLIRGLSQADSQSSLLDSLIHAGQLEAALADVDHHEAKAACELTDALAEILCHGGASVDPGEIAKRIKVPEKLNVSPPEGFTYYALHPLDFARVVDRLPVAARYALIGIRGIGTTLR